MTCLTEKIRVLDEPLPGVSHHAVGHAFTVNESTIQYIQKKEEEMCRSVQDVAPVSANVKSVVQDEAMETQLNVWQQCLRGHDTSTIRCGAESQRNFWFPHPGAGKCSSLLG